MNIAIIEDCAKDAESLRECICRYFLENRSDETVRVDCFHTAEQFFFDTQKRWQIVFMDIELPGMNGMDASQKLRLTDQEVPLLFVTNMAQYAVRGYDVQATGYILKPIGYSEFCLSMRRAMSAADRLAGRRIAVSTREGTEYILSRDVYFIEVRRHTLLYHTGVGIICGAGNLIDVQKSLEGEFLLCHRSYLVNPHYIHKIRKSDLVMARDEVVPIGRSRRKQFMEQFSQWLGRGNEG